MAHRQLLTSVSFAACLIPAVLVVPASLAAGAGHGMRKPSARRGYKTLRGKPFLPPDFDDDVFAELWKTWPGPLKERAAKATPAQRRKMAFQRYGLLEPPGGKGTGPAFGYTSDGKRGWVMNCFTCHAGKVAGRTIPGLPNTHLDLQTLIEDVRSTKLRLGKRLTHMDLGSLKIPLNTTVGTTNSVVFGVALGSLRDKDMNFVLKLKRPRFVHHDMDAPAWWNVKKKSMLYCDAFSPKNARVLMQFVLVPQNDRKRLLNWEPDFADILAYIESLKPPKYPWKIDSRLAAAGRTVFRRNCSRCHGTYAEAGGRSPEVGGNQRSAVRNRRSEIGGQNGSSNGDHSPLTTHHSPDSQSTIEPSYPQKVVPLKIIGTDPVRLRAISRAHRVHVRESWMSRYGKDPVVLDPVGYVAPPLDGVWASAPYFHNGSVPTLWHVLHPGKRPRVWKRKSADGYDRRRVGLPIETFDDVPQTVTGRAERRRYFDTRKFGKNAGGHRFPDALTEDEKRAVLEYLKTL